MPDTPRQAALVIVNPAGNRTRVPLHALPFTIGRQAHNHLVLRDNRISRQHARIVEERGEYFLEDLQSRHGVSVNQQRVTRQSLQHSDRIEFGVSDGYTLLFMMEEDEFQRILQQFAADPATQAPGTANLAKLRSLVEVARAMQRTLSTDDVLAAVVDAALAITATERGFLLLRPARRAQQGSRVSFGDETRSMEEGLAVRVARDRDGHPLEARELQVPMSVISRALRQRRELLTMHFDPLEEAGIRPEMSVANLELRSVVCVPLLRVRARTVEETCLLSAHEDTAGLLYLDSRVKLADLSTASRELLQTLALEASTILENARLLEEERAKQRLEEELEIARAIQASLLPPTLPRSGWFCAAGSSMPSHQVGGDYYDVRPLGPDRWCAMVADVSGKGVSSALLASLLQGAFLLGSEEDGAIDKVLVRLNEFLLERTGGEKYATVFSCTVDRGGLLRWANAGHCAPVVLHADGRRTELSATGTPVGMLPDARYGVCELRLSPGDKFVAFSDGLTEAQNAAGQFYDGVGFAETLTQRAAGSCEELHEALQQGVLAFSGDAVPADDITILVAEYRGC